MATNLLPRPITVDEFRATSEPPGDFAWELHYGELVAVTRPKLKHAFVQKRLLALLEPLAPSGGYLSSKYVAEQHGSGPKPATDALPDARVS